MHILRRKTAGLADNDLVALIVPLQHRAWTNAELLANFGGHRNLPLSREPTVVGRRIVIVHGNRSRWREEPETLMWTLSLGAHRPHGDLPRALRRRFPEAAAIVFGHTHRPHVETVDGAVVFNPGGVHQWNPRTVALRLAQKPGWFEWSWLQVARHLRDYSAPSVGILEVSRTAIVPTVIDL